MALLNFTALPGTPVANQVLLLNDQQVEDADTLRSLDVAREATFLLLRRAPLLSGAIHREELEHLLEEAERCDPPGVVFNVSFPVV